MLTTVLKIHIIKTSFIAFSCFVLLSFTASNEQATIYFEDDLCKLEVSKNRCNDIQNGTDVNYLFLRITNKTNKSISFSFTKQVIFSNNTGASNDGGKVLIFQLKPNEVLEGSCEKNGNSNLRIFSHMESLNDVARLSSFSFSDYKTTYTN